MNGRGGEGREGKGMEEEGRVGNGSEGENEEMGNEMFKIGYDQIDLFCFIILFFDQFIHFLSFFPPLHIFP